MKKIVLFTLVILCLSCNKGVDDIFQGKSWKPFNCDGDCRMIMPEYMADSVHYEGAFCLSEYKIYLKWNSGFDALDYNGNRITGEVFYNSIAQFTVNYKYNNQPKSQVINILSYGDEVVRLQVEGTSGYVLFEPAL